MGRLASKLPKKLCQSTANLPHPFPLEWQRFSFLAQVRQIVSSPWAGRDRHGPFLALHTEMDKSQDNNVRGVVVLGNKAPRRYKDLLCRICSSLVPCPCLRVFLPSKTDRRHRAYANQHTCRNREEVHPCQREDKSHLVEDKHPSFPDSSFPEKLWAFLEEFVRHHPSHSDNVVDAFRVVEDAPHAIDPVVAAEVVHFPIEDRPIEDRRSILHRIVAVAWDRLLSLYQWASWGGLLRVGVEVVDPYLQQLLAAEDGGFDTHPTVLLVQVSWEVLHVEGTFRQEGGHLATREAEGREIRIAPASPCNQEELRILVVGIAVVVACGHGLVAFHRAACHRPCAFCCLVAANHSPA